MNGQRGHALQVQLLLARGAVSVDPAFHVAVLLEEVLGELVGVEEHVEADLAGEDSPLVLPYEVRPHLKTVLELLPAKFATGLVCRRLLLSAFPSSRF